MPPSRRFIVVTLAAACLVFPGCRLRTRYDDAATKACTDEAASATRDAHDFKTRCDACCHQRGLDAVEPGSCACGKLGLDALLK